MMKASANYYVIENKTDFSIYIVHRHPLEHTLQLQCTILYINFPVKEKMANLILFNGGWFAVPV